MRCTREVLLTLVFMASFFLGQQIPVALSDSGDDMLFVFPVKAGPLYGREFKSFG